MDRITKLKAFLEQQPGDAFLVHALALEYEKTGDLPAALHEFEQLLAVQPEHTGSYYHYARLLYAHGETEKAKYVYEKGMAVCQAAGDAHALRELRSAYEEKFLD